MTYEPLLCHVIGDYCLQNQWMATRKTQSSLVALIHALFYSLPFLLLSPSWAAWGVIAGTHFAIDRWRLAKLWVDFWGIGNYGEFMSLISRSVGRVPPAEEAPPFLAVWLLIIVDNTAHVCINWAALRWL